MDKAPFDTEIGSECDDLKASQGGVLFLAEPESESFIGLRVLDF